MLILLEQRLRFHEFPFALTSTGLPNTEEIISHLQEQFDNLDRASFASLFSLDLFMLHEVGKASRSSTNPPVRPPSESAPLLGEGPAGLQPGCRRAAHHLRWIEVPGRCVNSSSCTAMSLKASPGLGERKRRSNSLYVSSSCGNLGRGRMPRRGVSEPATSRHLSL